MKKMMKFMSLFLILLISIFSCKPAEPTLEEYLSMPVWDKEEKAMRLLTDASGYDGIDALKETLNKAAGLMREVEKKITRIRSNDPKIKNLNSLQIDICRIYQDAAKGFNETSDLEILDGLKEADNDMREFLSLITIK